MANQLIQSRSNPVIQLALDVKSGKNKLFAFCEGSKILFELTADRLNFECLLVSVEGMAQLKLENRTNLIGRRTYVVSPSIMKQLSDLETPPGFIALFPRPASSHEELDEHGLYLVLHGIQLPQNMGNLFRTAEAAGVSEVWVSNKSVDLFSPKVIRGSTGSVFRLRHRLCGDLTEILNSFNEKSISVIAASQNAKVRYYDYDWNKGTALVVAQEGKGFSPVEFKMFFESVTIPMKGQAESLNVGTAAAICLFEAMRVREKAIK